MLAGLILVALSVRQKPKIDYEVRATSLYNALGKLARVTGLKLKVEPAMANEVVCADARQVDPNTLLAKIASATYCEWRAESGAQVLYRPLAVTRRLRDSEITAQTDFLNRLFERKRLELKKVGTPSSRAEGLVKAIRDLEAKMAIHPTAITMDRPRLAAPESSLTLQLSLDVETRVLGELLDGQSLTFSNIPTNAQRPYGAGAQRFIDDYVDAETHLLGILPKREPHEWARGLLNDIYESAEAPSGVGKVLLRIYRIGRALSMSATVYSGVGKKTRLGIR